MGVFVTREEAERLVGVIQAFSAGREVQMLMVSGDGKEAWIDHAEPTFDPKFSWRIKPMPRRWWIGWCPKHGPELKASEDKPTAMCDYCQIVPVIENLNYSEP